MNQYTDQQLIAKTLEGHTASFGALVVRYQDFIFTIVIRMVKHREEAEEIAQDSFVKAFEGLKTFQGKSKFSSWLYSIAYRTALDYLRKSKRFQDSIAVEEVNDLEVATLENGLQQLVVKERAKIIQECIMKLPEMDAAIITFYYFEELSVREIAKITEQSEDNIKIKLYRSRKKLYSLLAPFVTSKAITHGRAI
ncbi:RNA polymerase sigma factor [Rasiella sp. SM2506]|uniref:RNA polymerase sigma factor n=1 Tax=Rasiella sp. SM2506 TaxID=3423914 RepID=UPI003D7B8578